MFLKKLMEIVIKELEKIIEELSTFENLEIPYSSLLIVYDSEYFLNLEISESKVCSRRSSDFSFDNLIENCKEEKSDATNNHSLSTCYKDEENLSSSSYSSTLFYTKEKLNIKIIDFAYIKPENLKKIDDITQIMEPTDIMNAISNLIKFLKKRTDF